MFCVRTFCHNGRLVAPFVFLSGLFIHRTFCTSGPLVIRTFLLLQAIFNVSVLFPDGPTCIVNIHFVDSDILSLDVVSGAS
jgi:hypothetical protein